MDRVVSPGHPPQGGSSLVRTVVVMGHSIRSPKHCIPDTKSESSICFAQPEAMAILGQIDYGLDPQHRGVLGHMKDTQSELPKHRYA